MNFSGLLTADSCISATLRHSLHGINRETDRKSDTRPTVFARDNDKRGNLRNGDIEMTSSREKAKENPSNNDAVMGELGLHKKGKDTKQ